MSNTGIPKFSDPIWQQRLDRKPAGIYYYSRKKKRLRQLLTGMLSLFIIFGLCFLGFLYAPIQPFGMLRELWVTSAMTTLNHQYLATYFLHKDPVSSFNIIGLNRDDVLVLGHYTLNQIKQMDVRDAVTFSPFLVVDGKPSITHGDGGWGIAPRTAIGQTKEGSILMLVIDGRKIGSLRCYS